jgi:hypothetical protein
MMNFFKENANSLLSSEYKLLLLFVVVVLLPHDDSFLTDIGTGSNIFENWTTMN